MLKAVLRVWVSKILKISLMGMRDEKTENENEEERNSTVVVVTINMTSPSLSSGVIMVHVLCQCQLLRINNECFFSYLRIDIDFMLLPCYHILYLLLQQTKLLRLKTLSPHEVTSSMHDHQYVLYVQTVMVQYNTQQCGVMHEEISLNVSGLILIW